MPTSVYIAVEGIADVVMRGEATRGLQGDVADLKGRGGQRRRDENGDDSTPLNPLRQVPHAPGEGEEIEAHGQLELERFDPHGNAVEGSSVYQEGGRAR
jgi:hypothetical protein